MISSGLKPKVSKPAQWLFPSLKDFLFLIMLFLLMLPKASSALSDSDTGWHIRNGEHILQTKQWVYTDYFSHSGFGKPWFAWEWLADIVMALIHQSTGLNGIVVWANLTFAAVLALLFRWVTQRGGNIFFCFTFTLVGGLAASVHSLARPHLFTLLFTLIWYMLMERIRTKQAGKLYWIWSLLLLVWVNLHPGFVIGLILPVIFAVGSYLSAVCSREEAIRAEQWILSRRFAILALLSFLMSLLNPYGLDLYRHISESYFHSQFLSDHVNEWTSPDFHAPITKFYEFILLASLVVFAVSYRRLNFSEIGLVVFFTHLSLYSRRHIPLYVVIVMPLIMRHLTECLTALESEQFIKPWLRRKLEGFNTFSKGILLFECQFKGLLIPCGTACILVVLCLNRGYWAGEKVLDANFDPSRFPIRAAEFIESFKPKGKVFTTDSWGGFVIYRFHPRYGVFIDGRSDMYGQRFIEQYLKVRDLNYEWKEVLEEYRIEWILLPVHYGLATTLKELRGWKSVYDDQNAIIFVKN